MRKLIFMTVMATGLSFAGYSQGNGGVSGAQGQQRPRMTPQEHAERESNRAAANLGLNADQKSKWQAAALERINANSSLHDKMKGSTSPEERQQVHQTIEANNAKFDATVDAFLTPEQKTKYDQERENMKNHHGNKGGRGGGRMNSSGQ